MGGRRLANLTWPEVPEHSLLVVALGSCEQHGPHLPLDTDLRIAFIGAEPHTEGLRKRVEEGYGVKAYNSYGLSEMSGPGVAFECPEQNGMHIWEDAFLLVPIYFTNAQKGKVVVFTHVYE